MKSLNSPRLFLAASLLAAGAIASTIAAERSSSTMAGAATKFLGGLTAEQRQQATFPFESEERLHWHFIPTETFPRKGLTIKEMTEPQRKLAHELLKAGLSQRGYLTASSIMELETVLGALEAAQRAAAAQPPRNTPLVRDPERYFFSVFGTPSEKSTWGWRVEGHHVSLHFTVVNGTMVAGSPSFFGSNPAEVREGPKKGTRLLAAEEDAARALLESLDATQKPKAIFDATAPGDMLTMANVNISPLSPTGLAAEAMTPAQRDLLMKLVDVYAGKMAPDIAAERLAAEESGRREDRVRVGGRDGEGEEALLSRPGPDLPDRVRQHPERRQPHPLGVEGLQRRLRAGPAERTPAIVRTLADHEEHEDVKSRVSTKCTKKTTNPRGRAAR